MPGRQEKYANGKYAATNETKRQIQEGKHPTRLGEAAR